MDDDLEQIRARRLAQLQQQYGDKVQPGGGGGQGGGNAAAQAAAEEKRRDQEAEMRNSILSQILSQEARSRLATLSVAKPEKAKMVENLLISNAQMGRLPGKLSEADLKGLLEKVSEQTAKKTTVTYDRRRMALDDSDED